MSDSYLTTHNTWDPHLVLPLLVEAHQGDSVYVDPLWGVAIQQVIADGEPVPGFEHDIDLDDMNLQRMQVGGTPFIYRVRFQDFVFARHFSEEDFELLRYELPRQARHLRIEYRVRQAPDHFGPVLILDSYRVD